MALINCLECGKEISDKVSVCPNCGCPINANESQNKLVCPTFPENLNIGKNVTSLGSNTKIRALLNEDLCTQKNFFSSGEATILLHTHGIEIIVAMKNIKLHNSQIISIKKTSSAELKMIQNSSVIGRAVLGNLIMGSTGALIGGLSALEAKEKLVTNQIVTINYWDISSKIAHIVILKCIDQEEIIDYFLLMREHELQVNEESNRVAEEQNLPLISKICIIILFVVIITFLFLNFFV